MKESRISDVNVAKETLEKLEVGGLTKNVFDFLFSTISNLENCMDTLDLENNVEPGTWAKEFNKE